jgi:Skp family chaperone for outer membrane proteins
LKKTYETNVKKFSDMEKKLKKEEADLLAKKNVLSKEDFGKEMNSLRNKSIEYQKQRRSAIDTLTTKRAEARKKLLEKLKPILESHIEKNKVALIVDKKSILGGSPDFDITKTIVEKLNKEIPSLNLK